MGGWIERTRDEVRARSGPDQISLIGSLQTCFAFRLRPSTVTCATCIGDNNNERPRPTTSAAPRGRRDSRQPHPLLLPAARPVPVHEARRQRPRCALGRRRRRWGVAGQDVPSRAGRSAGAGAEPRAGRSGAGKEPEAHRVAPRGDVSSAEARPFAPHAFARPLVRRRGGGRVGWRGAVQPFPPPGRAHV